MRDPGDEVYTIVMGEYLAVNKVLLTANYSLCTVIVSGYFAGIHEIMITAKYSLYTRIASKHFAVN